MVHNPEFYFLFPLIYGLAIEYCEIITFVAWWLYLLCINDLIVHADAVSYTFPKLQFDSKSLSYVILIDP